MFGFFKKRPKSNPAAEPPPARPNGATPEPGPTVDDVNQRPRDQHYVFAHIMLRQLAEQHGTKLLALFSDDDKAMAMLRQVWTETHRACVDHAAERGDAPPEALPATNLNITRGRAANRPAAVVELPTPEFATECYAVAIVGKFRLDQDRDELPSDDPGVYYFTLERGVRFKDDDPVRSVLCEWTENGTHANHGDGPTDTSAKGFLTALDDHLD